MPGFELIGAEEKAEVDELFDKSGILFRHSFDQLRNGIYKVKDFESAFADYMNVTNALAVSSGTAALRVALAGLGIGPGDEVITQAFTFVATVEAIIDVGATPIVTEVDKTLNMDPVDLEKKITEKTKAIIVVHMLGTPARMDEIVAIAKKHNLKIIEDTAWGCGGKLHEKYLGTIGDVGTFSFDFAKTITTGEGGMVVSHDQFVADKAAAYHDHGHENNPKLPRWEDSRSGPGFNYRMTEMQGAVGLAQLKKLNTVVTAQRTNKEKIEQVLKKFANNIELRAVPEGSYETADAVVFFVKSPELAISCRENLLASGLGTKILPEAVTWHFAATWTHMPALVQQYPNLANAFPASKSLLDCSVALPVTVKMGDEYLQKLEDALTAVFAESYVE
jgi:8-amino-3,8-dideoxy-alpha-D-manno-octulosonate transaminase